MKSPHPYLAPGSEFVDHLEQATFLVERGYHTTTDEALAALAQHELSAEAREELFLNEDDAHDH